MIITIMVTTCVIVARLVIITIVLIIIVLIVWIRLPGLNSEDPRPTSLIRTPIAATSSGKKRHNRQLKQEKFRV